MPELPKSILSQPPKPASQPSINQSSGISTQSKSLGLDPDEDPSPELLANADFTQKSEALKKLDAQAYREEKLSENDPFKGLFILQYKSNGPIQNVFFKSSRVPALVQRDCQIWCRAHNVRFLNFKPALIDIMNLRSDLELDTPAGDISEIVTRQSRLGTNFKVPELTPNAISDQTVLPKS